MSTIHFRKANHFSINHQPKERLDFLGGKIYGSSTLENGNWNVINGDYLINGSPILPVGVVMPYAANPEETPKGWLLCDGSEKPVAEYRRLAAALGSLYGTASSPSTHFVLPDLRGRIPLCSGQGSGLTNRQMSSTGGDENVTLTTNHLPSHNHAGTTVASGTHNHTGTTDTNGSHNHNVGNTVQKTGQNTPGSLDSSSGGGGSEIDTINTGTTTTNLAGNHTHTFTTNNSGEHNHTFTTDNTGNNQSHNNMQPFLVMNYIIRY